MKRKIGLILVCVLCLVTLTVGLVACGGGDNILVVSRELGSGTRDAFDSLVKNEAGDTLKKTAGGEERDAVVKTANVQNSTGNVMTKVASVKNSIGYISMGSLNDTVKSVKVNGVEVSAENVLNNTYKLQRPFVIMTNKSAKLTTATEEFIKYLNKNQAQEVVNANKFVKQVEGKTEYVAPAETISGEVVIKGSTSVDPLMDKLIADFKKIGGSKVQGVEFKKDATGSSAGISAAKADTAGNVIGMSSSKMKEADAPSLNYFSIALDAVAVIVNKSNTIDNLTIAQLYDIYTGVIKSFNELA